MNSGSLLAAMLTFAVTLVMLVRLRRSVRPPYRTPFDFVFLSAAVSGEISAYYHFDPRAALPFGLSLALTAVCWVLAHLSGRPHNGVRGLAAHAKSTARRGVFMREPCPRLLHKDPPLDRLNTD